MSVFPEPIGQTDLGDFAAWISGCSPITSQGVLPNHVSTTLLPDATVADFLCGQCHHSATDKSISNCWPNLSVSLPDFAQTLEAESEMMYRDRVVDRELVERMEASGPVLIEGPKACGKTETALTIAKPRSTD